MKNVKIIFFFENASIHFARTNFQGEFSFKCYGKVDLTIEKCEFYADHKINLHEKVFFKCENNKYFENFRLFAFKRIDLDIECCIFNKQIVIILLDDTVLKFVKNCVEKPTHLMEEMNLKVLGKAEVNIQNSIFDKDINICFGDKTSLKFENNGSKRPNAVGIK